MEENRKGASRRVISKQNNGAIVRASLWPKVFFLGGLELWEGGEKVL